MPAAPTRTDQTPLAALILRGLGGQHLDGFLPGRDHKAAVSAAVASMHGWSGPGAWGDVTRRGIGEWDHFQHHADRKPADAVLFVTWPELLAVVERGCASGHRERYEAARTAWFAEVGPYDPVKGSCGYPSPAATARLHEAAAALIRHGCQQGAVQESLF